MCWESDMQEVEVCHLGECEVSIFDPETLLGNACDS